MVALILGMLICVALAVVVVGIVAVPARRAGRDVLTERGEDVVTRIRERTGGAVETAIDKTGEAISTAKGKVHDAGSRQAS